MAEPQQDAGFGHSIVPTPLLRAWIRPEWWGAATVEAGSDDGVIHVAATCEVVGSDVSLEAYAATVDASIVADTDRVSDTALLLDGRPTVVRLIEWRSEKGEDLVTLLALAVDEGWGVRCAGTAPAAVFERRHRELTELFDHLDLPWSHISVAGTTAVLDVERAVNRAVEKSLSSVPASWETVRDAWERPPVDAPSSGSDDVFVASGAELVALALAAGVSSFPGVRMPFGPGDAAFGGALHAARSGLVARGLVEIDEDGVAAVTSPARDLVAAALEATMLVAVRSDHPNAGGTTVFAGNPLRFVRITTAGGDVYRLSPLAPASLLVRILELVAAEPNGPHCDISVIRQESGRATANELRLAVRGETQHVVADGVERVVTSDEVRRSLLDLLPHT